MYNEANLTHSQTGSLTIQDLMFSKIEDREERINKKER